MEITKGTIVDDRYELAARLDGVGLGEAWRARDPNVASRTFTVTLLGAVAGELSAADEDHLKALRRLRHPSLLPTITQGVWAGRLYVVQGPIAGRTLRDHHGEGPGAPGARAALREVDAIFQQVAAAVGAAHAASPAVVHGDLHPGAVLVSAEGKGTPAVQVVGFGHGRFLAPEDGSRDARFTAPERGRGAPDVAGDIYALGMLLRWLLEEHDRARPSVAFPDGRRGRADVPDAVWCLVERCTHARPAERPRRVDELLAALGPAWKGSPRPPAPPAPPPPPPPATTEDPKAPVSFVPPPTVAAVAGAPLIEVATDRSVPAEAAFADVTERGAPSLPLEAPPQGTPPGAVANVAEVPSSSASLTGAVRPSPASNKRLGEMRLSGGPPVPRRRAPAEEADAAARAGAQTVMLGEESFGEGDAQVGGRTLAREEAPVGGRTVALEAAFGVDDAPAAAQTLLVDEAPTTVATTSVAPRRATAPAPAPTPAPAPPPAPEERRWSWWRLCLVVAAVLAALALADALLASLV